MKYFVTAIVLLMTILTACQVSKNKHLITDKSYRKLVHEQYLKQKELAHGRDSVLFGVFNQQLTKAEIEGLEFLYAFMPLSDLAMNDGKYNLSQVRTSLEAKALFGWGNTVPEDVYLHFVLPYRVNNEYTDTARQVFFGELKDRIKGMDMARAALEVNHWCHEKVNYKSTDERTSGPLTSVRTAFGRCGEESTFTVAALRSVGIPARQVYTPRWAHTDDNHAWVEVWVDGKWYFMGACEPEPALDMGWFAEPAKRAMMMHTFVFGQYHGNEEVLEKNDMFTRLNLLNNYTKTKTLPVKVIDIAGNPVEKARVEYSLYNYAEFYPIATLFTDARGICSTTTGFGDLLMWASKDGLFSYKVAPGSSADTVLLTLDKPGYNLPSEILLLTPPAKQALPPTDQSEADENNRRLQQEDSIRNAYIATFIDSTESVKLANEKGLDAKDLWSYLSRSRGNWKEIVAFVKSLAETNSATGMDLLALVSEKDLHDIQASTLSNHLIAYTAYTADAEISESDILKNYVLSPRIGREMVTPWRSFIQQYFSSAQADSFRNNPAGIATWINDNIKSDSVSNYYNVPVSPVGVLQLGLADNYSRNLLFVAICRSFAIPARLEPAARIPQFLSKGEWHNVFTGRKMAVSAAKGTIALESISDDKTFVPQYYVHYTIARLDKGRFITLDYEYDESLKTFPCRLSVDTGYYRLVTGNRQSDGSVICNISYFRVRMNEVSKISISLASEKQQSGVLGKADLQASYRAIGTDKIKKLQDVAGNRGMIVALTDPGKEPTKHLMEDIKAVKSSLDTWGGQVLFVVAKDKLTTGFNPSQYKAIPENAEFGYDQASEISASISTVCSISGAPQLPVVVLINPQGEIVWHSEGYSIGLGDQLVKQIKGLDMK